MLLIHSDRPWLLAFAAASNAFRSSAVKRTGTIRPLACPFGSFGRPTFLVFFCWLKASKLLNYRRSYSQCRRNYRPKMQDCDTPPWFLLIICIVRPRMRFRIFPSINSAQPCPTRTPSRMIVSRCTPVMRSICRIAEPSASALTIWTCFSMLRAFAMCALPMAISVLQKYGAVNSCCDTLFPCGPGLGSGGG